MDPSLFYELIRRQYRGKIRNMSKEEKAYIAGFLDADGCIMCQLVRRKDYRFGFQIRTSIVFYQKTTHQKILYWLKQKLVYGYIRNRKDGMTEYTIVGFKEVLNVLEEVYKFLKLKKDLVKLTIRLIKSFPKKLNEENFVKLSELVDKTAEFNYSKKRKNTSKTLKKYLEHISDPRRD